ncbi:unnamed protein product [Dovyalis caffra]|uniref:ATP synthase subunit O, mitochondrial n=1 Tax=Dovyalis caffra TaxID=77055 RepID=A0AAV1RBI5_9ROSI|nr:unnamed protein product [Dovyalis caffra]
MAAPIRSGFALLNRVLRSDSLSTQRSAIQRSVLTPAFTASEYSKNLSTSSLQKEEKIKLPITLYGGTGNYASALYTAAKKSKVLDQVESEVFDLMEASKNSPNFSQFLKDLSVPADTRIKAINEICGAAKFSDITKNFLAVVAENGRLNYLESIVNKFKQLTMADKGIVKAIVITVIPLPPQEEKELKETLQEVIGQGKKVEVEQKIDPSILGGIMVEFEQKLFDMSIRTRAKQMERYLREPADFDAL